jgi:tRNA A37 threonylcarbamoyladenosine modification protein TsaB
MYKIYLDTSKRYLNKVTLYKNDRVLDHKEGDFDVVTVIADLLSAHNIKPEDVFIDYFEGPGDSFTGLKIGSAIANTFNFATGKIKSADVRLPNYGREPNISERKQI